MTQPVNFTEADQALCLGVLKQIEVGKVDYEVLSQALGLPSKGAAQVRWSRFNSKLKKDGDKTFTAAEEALCLGVIQQIEVGKVDYEALSKALGLPSKGAAQVRRSRFGSKLKKGLGDSPAKTATTPPTTPNGKATKPKGKNSSAKKRKIDDENQAEDQAPETPTKVARRGKGTKSTKAVVKGEEDGDEADGFVAKNFKEEEKELDDFVDSGNGTGEEASEEAFFSGDEA